MCILFHGSITWQSFVPVDQLSMGKDRSQHWEAHEADAMVEEGSQASSYNLRAQSPVKDISWSQEGEGELSLPVVTRFISSFYHRVCWGKEWYFSLGI